VADTETLPKPKHPGGRPSKYQREFCEKIIQCGKQGMCVAEMADELDVRIATLYNWAEEFPEFLEAFSRAQEAAESYWAKSVRDGLKKAPSEFQGPANLKYMAQRFKGWSEKAHVDTRETDPAEEPETPDARSAARRAAFLLSKGVQSAE
jgi:hypothetical protein